MIQETIFPFKLVPNRHRLTAKGGLFLLAESYVASGLAAAVERSFGSSGKNRGYHPESYLQTLVYLLALGGRCLSDVRELADDPIVTELLGLEVPSCASLSRWLRDPGTLPGVLRASNRLARSLVRHSNRRTFTLDIDATFIPANKATAAFSHCGRRGYYPMTGWLAEEEIAIGQQFRAGNISPGSGLVEFVRSCLDNLPAGKSIRLLRSDAAGYQGSLINECHRRGMKFLIRASRDRAVVRAVWSIPSDRWRALPSDLGPGLYAETVHTMSGVEAPFRLIVLKRPKQASLWRPYLFRDDYVIFALATNDWDRSAVDLIRCYNQRGQAENLIKELKYGFAQNRMPCTTQQGNAVWFALGGIAYNLVQYLKLFVLGGPWVRSQAATLRWRLFQIAGQVVHTGRRVLLSLRCPEATVSWLNDLRHRLCRMARAPAPT